MHQDKAIELAREAAVDCDERHDYMPATPLLAEVWHPHRWVVDAMLNAAAVAEGERDRYRSGNTKLLGLLMQFCEGTPGTKEETLLLLADAGLLVDGAMNWQALKDREPKQQTWAEAVNECVTDPAERARLLALGDAGAGATDGR